MSNARAGCEIRAMFELNGHGLDGSRWMDQDGWIKMVCEERNLPNHQHGLTSGSNVMRGKEHGQ